MFKRQKNKGFTLIEIIIGIMITSIVVTVAYSLMNVSAKDLKNETNAMYTQNDLNTIVEFITRDIKKSKIYGEDDSGKQSVLEQSDGYKIEMEVGEVYYKLIEKSSGIFNLVRESNDGKVILSDRVTGLNIKIPQVVDGKLDTNLYDVKLTLVDSKTREVDFSVYKQNYYASTLPEPSDMDYYGYLVTMDYSKHPCGQHIPTGIPNEDVNFETIYFNVITSPDGYQVMLHMKNEAGKKLGDNIFKDVTYNLVDNEYGDQDEIFKDGSKYALSPPYYYNLKYKVIQKNGKGEEGEKPFVIKGYYIKGIEYFANGLDMDIDINGSNVDILTEVELPNDKGTAKILFHFDKPGNNKINLKWNGDEVVVTANSAIGIIEIKSASITP